jgi:16S rRNA (cytosine967-C5)-methyltransferase
MTPRRPDGKGPQGKRTGGPRRPERPGPRRGRPVAPRGAGERRGSPSRREEAELLPLLCDLWTAYVSEDEPPYLDRWLARTLSQLDGLSRGKRLWLGARLTDAVRYAWLALLCDEAYGHGGSQALRHVRAGVTDTVDGWRRLGSMPAEVLLFWVFVGLRSAGQAPPRLDEPEEGMLGLWHRVRAALEEDDSLTARLVMAGLPASLAPGLQRRRHLSGWSDAEVKMFLTRQGERPPLWLRLRDPADVRAVQEELWGAGFKIAVDADAIRAVGERGVAELECWKDGRVEVQDLASQFIGRSVDAAPGLFVWDACAGGGGKALQLAAHMGGTGAVYATDPNERALADLRRRARRAGLTSVRAYPWDGEALPDFGKSVARRGGFDRVLVDAPCSGSGTWRRNPDGRLRYAPDDLPDLAARQVRLLEIAAGAVSPGGLLVYATCSWLAEENEDVVRAFLADDERFEMTASGIHGNPAADADTTFSAVLRRRP